MADLPDFSSFSLTDILSEDTRTKSVAVCGTFKTQSDQKAVIIAEKQPIPTQSLPLLFSSLSRLKLGFQNDIYSQYETKAPNGIGSLKLTSIYPATDKHVIKYSNQKVFMIKETPNDYEAITKPYIEEQAFSLQWVYNILDGKSEVDRIIYNDPNPDLGFVLLPDMKWDTTDLNSLYLVAIVRRRGIASLRDLKTSHVPLLRCIQDKTKEVVQQVYGIQGNQLRFYIHYQPSYYHFHVHVTALRYEAPGCQVGRAHLLDDVIDNLEVSRTDGEYYQKKCLHFVLREHDELLKKFVLK